MAGVGMIVCKFGCLIGLTCQMSAMVLLHLGVVNARNLALVNASVAMYLKDAPHCVNVKACVQTMKTLMMSNCDRLSSHSMLH